MATVKEILAARLAKAKLEQQQEKQHGTNPTVQSTGQLASSNGQEVSGSSHDVDSQAGSVTGTVGQADGSGPSRVATGAELQSAVTVVLELPNSRPEEPAAGSPAETDLDTSNPIHFNFLNSLQELTDALLARDPRMKSHLAAIHRTMIEHEELPNLLRPHEIAKIMAAQQLHTNVVLSVASTKKAKSASAKSLKQITIDDL